MCCDSWGRKESDTTEYACNHMRAKTIHWRKNNFFSTWCWENWISTCEIKLGSHLTLYPRADLLQNGLVGSPFSTRDSEESSLTPQFKSINSSVLSLLHSPTLTSIHDHRKNHSRDQMNLCWQSNVSAFEYAI